MSMQGNLQLPNTLVQATKMCFVIQMANLTLKDIWLMPRIRLGTTCEAEQVFVEEQVNYELESNEVIASCPLVTAL